jgi:hypothetical protein
MHGGIRSVKKDIADKYSSITGGKGAFGCYRADAYPVLHDRIQSRQAGDQGAERVNGRAHGEVSQRRHMATSGYAAISILNAGM